MVTRRRRICIVTALSAATVLTGAQGLAAAAADPPSAPQAPPQSAGATDATTAAGNDPASDLESLRQQLKREEERLRQLEERIRADEAKQAATAPPTSGPAAVGNNVTPSGAPAVTPAASPNAVLGSLGENGLVFQSADGQNVIHIGANISVDYRTFLDSYTPASADTWLLRKARPILEGTLDGIFDFRFMPDFANGKAIIQDAWVAVRAEPWLFFEFGKFKAPVGLERLQLEQYQRFIEPSLTADLLPYRDLGAEVAGNIAHGLLTYQVAMFDGAPDGGSTDALSTPDTNSTGKFTWDGRVFSLPFSQTDISALRGFGLGVSGTYVNDRGVNTTTSTISLLAADKTPGQQPMFAYRGDGQATYNNATIAAGIERRTVPQAYWYYDRFYLLGEYVWETQQVFRNVSTKLGRSDTLDNSAWQIQGGLFLTGEPEAYDSLVVFHEVGKGGFGAVELVARVHSVRFDNAAFLDGSESFANIATAARFALAHGVGINWYLTKVFKIQLDFEDTRFEGDATVGNRPDEKVLTAQFAITF
jgi:phosphate-selective porin OprO and OprP